MKVSELIDILQSFDANSDVIIYDDSTDRTYELNCVDTDDSESVDNKSTVVIFI